MFEAPRDMKMTDEEDRAWLLYICKGNHAACDFLFMFFAMCHLWDDLIDKDKARTDADINRAFWVALIEMPRNRYYQDFQSEIQPLMAVAIQEWFVANELEAGNRKDIAYTLRCSIVSLIHQAAEICGGYDWAISVGEEIRLKSQSETIDEYMKELSDA
jgi:hypothetical protein